MHTIPSNNKRKAKQQKLALLRKAKSEDKKPMVSTLTHTTREVAEHFFKWRENLKETMIGHNGGPKIDD